MLDNNSLSGGQSLSNGQSQSCFSDDSSSSHESESSMERRHRNNHGPEKLAQTETRVVKWSRVLVFAVLVIAATVVGYCTHWLVMENELSHFQHAYGIAANEIIEVSQQTIMNLYGIVFSLSLSISTLAKNSVDAQETPTSRTPNSSTAMPPWPYYQIPDFDILGADTMRMIHNSAFLAFAPIISEDERMQWNEYSTTTLRQTILPSPSMINATTIPTLAPPTTATTTTSTTPTTTTTSTGAGQYSPVWQLAPVPITFKSLNLINFDFQNITTIRQLLQYVTDTGLPSIAQLDTQQMIQLQTFTDSIAIMAMESDWIILSDFDTNHIHHDRNTSDTDSNTTFNTTSNTKTYADPGPDPTTITPQVVLVQPVYDHPVQMHEHRKYQQDANTANPHVVVGHLITLFPWTTLLENILDDNIAGIHVVIQDSCNRHTATHLIKGRHVAWLGSDDQHDSNYDKYHQTSSIGLITSKQPLQQQQQQQKQEQYGLCTYSLTVYPSSETLNLYTTNDPAIYTVVVVMIFVFTSIVFIFYDYVVQKRQRKVLKTAVRSTAIVSSLFPENVRDQLFAQDENGNTTPKKRSTTIASTLSSLAGGAASAGFSKNDDDNNNGTANNNHNLVSNVSSEAPPKRRLNSFLNYGTAETLPDTDDELFDSRPIADLFPHATVMFADISGFTAWSSVREPCQVFTLLETVYRAFDKIAKQRRVFKVETIGDCYVAVVGLPEPRKDHAVVMARFARDCKAKFNELSHRLEVTLGPDTGDLAMRFGLHSGPVTAGVLRGERARFQLFGDTVNTASRIESTGQRNRIHLSQQTADLIIGAGKANWVKLREEKIVAKGKGELETYWLLEKDEMERPSSSIDSGENENSSTFFPNPYAMPGSLSHIKSKGASAAANNGEDDDDGASSRLLQDINNKYQDKNNRNNIALHGRGGRVSQDVTGTNASGNAIRSNSDHDGGLPLSFPGKASANNAGSGGGSGAAGTGKGGLSLVGANGAGLTIRKGTSDKVKRLIGWNCEVLLQLLRQIVARRAALKTRRQSVEPLMRLEAKIGKSGSMVLDEVVEVVKLPNFDSKLAKKQADPRTVDLGEQVESQLRSYVAIIASKYRENPFHNFEHASHVTMSTVKLLSRIVAPDVDVSVFSDKGRAASELHDYTYGITSDPLTQFAVVLSALIHDVDHRGVPNFLLIKEEEDLAAIYKNKSVAEQNSVDVAWEALMDPSFEELRNTIYTDEFELNRFRQLIVNSVMATDIFDRELSALRKKRWDKAFQTTQSAEGGGEAATANNNSTNNKDAINRKATIVIEHLIQASDVAHTMQHWQVYQKWNQRLFEEMYTAYQLGRSNQDPSAGWYKGELGFLDNYVVPLAKKLKNCGVFGVSSDEYLNYATENRREWELKGESIVEDLVRKYKLS